MLKRKLREMIKEHGRVVTKQILLEEIIQLQERIARASNIYLAIDIEHDLLDCQSMVKWLENKDV